MSADVVVQLNPIDISRRRVCQLADDTPLLAWVDAQAPAPAGVRVVYVNGVPCADPAYRVHPHDEILVGFAPGGWEVVAYYALQAVVSMAIGYVAGKLFAPKRPTALDTPSPSQVYGIAPPKNAARLGQPIPVIYGSVIALPDFAAQPYVEYLSNDQFLCALLCLGQGDHDVTEMLLGTTSTKPLPTTVVFWSAFLPSQHNSTFGFIESATAALGSKVRENVSTSPAVGDQELKAPVSGVSQWIGPFETCKAGQVGTLLEVDVVFPVGLYSTDGSGNLQVRGVDLTFEATPIDAAGNPVGGAGAVITHNETFTASLNTPQRFTRSWSVPSARYRVRAARITPTLLATAVGERAIWGGLKFQLAAPPAGTVVYGNVTLIAVRLRATNGVAADAAGSMRFRCKRRLLNMGQPGSTTATSNPADAFVDILSAPYGGARPVNTDEIDLNELALWKSVWVNHNGFNAVFDQPSTVWEALTLALQTVHAAPLPVGSRMSLVNDTTQSVRSQLFTDANVVAGSLQVSHAFDTTGTPAGVRVNYRDPATFAPASVYQPVNQPDYTTLDLFGCTDVTVAQEHANLAQAKRQKQRKSLTFSTELEGLNVLPGDRIGVQAGLVKWAQAARVASVAGTTLTLDRALAWTANATHAAQLRDPTGAPWSARPVTRGAADNVLVLPQAPPFTLVGANASQEATALSFGVQDAEVTDWTVVKVTPNGDTVTVEAVNYDASIYAGAAAFTRGEVLDAEEAAA